MNLPTQIKQYYFENSAELSEDKRFHFGTRIAAWDGDPRAFNLLREAKDYIAPPNKPFTTLFSELLSAEQNGRRNAHELRAPFFAKYPTLFGTHAVLFRVRHLEAVYQVDAREDLFKIISRESLDQLASDLENDADALRILSTFAVNYLYLYKQQVLGLRLDPGLFMRAAQAYNLDNPEHIKLLIYLYTHTIIGASNFYTRHVPSGEIDIYTAMLKELEPIINSNFKHINLDNKLEFLVCCRLCDYPTELFDKVYDECERSVSSDGTFVIDRHNQNLQTDRATFEKSEHRNVLYIMSSTTYNPHATIVA